MDNGHPGSPAHEYAGDERLVRIVSQVAFSVALVVLIALPFAYWSFAYRSLSTTLVLEARIKAAALGPLVTANPEVWMHEELRLKELLDKYPFPLVTESAQIYALQGDLVAESGEKPASPALSRSAPLYDFGREAGRVDVNDSLRAVIVGTGIATLLGMLLAGAVFVTLRVVPLRALRNVTGALFAQKELAQVTLNSIGDAVIATDQGERVESMNPAAEILTGWDLREVSGKPLAEVLKLCDATTGNPIPNPLLRQGHQNVRDRCQRRACHHYRREQRCRGTEHGGHRMLLGQAAGP